MKIYQVKLTTPRKGERVVLLAQYSKADEKWLDFVGADDETAMMSAAEQKDECIRRTSIMLEPYGLKMDDIHKFEESNRNLYVGKTIDGDTYKMEFVSQLEKPDGIFNFIDWLDAHAEARRQFECHRDCVSGVWSIDAEEFCKHYNLDYDHAKEAGFEMMSDGFDEYVLGERARVENIIGELTDEQVDALYDKAHDLYGDSGFDEGMWFDILNTLEKAPEFEKYYDEYKHESYEEYYV